MPWPDRTVEEWKSEIAEDQGLVRRYVEEALRDDADDAARQWALAIKEARRMLSDLYRMAAKAGVSREEIDRVGL